MRTVYAALEGCERLLPFLAGPVHDLRGTFGSPHSAHISFLLTYVRIPLCR